MAMENDEIEIIKEDQIETVAGNDEVVAGNEKDKTKIIVPARYCDPVWISPGLEIGARNKFADIYIGILKSDGDPMWMSRMIAGFVSNQQVDQVLQKFKEWRTFTELEAPRASELRREIWQETDKEDIRYPIHVISNSGVPMIQNLFGGPLEEVDPETRAYLMLIRKGPQ